MLFDYKTPEFQSNSQSGVVGTVWSQFPLQPLAPGVLSPFSYSVLSELVGRAWYLYYDRLGFEPAPRSRVVRRYKGHVYFNLSLSAQLEADHAALEPALLRFNGTVRPLATWEKPGFLAGFKVGRAQKKIDDLWAETSRQMGGITEKARSWYLKTQGIQRWGQAEVLQIMEEIERVGVESMVAFFAARFQLSRLYSHLVRELTDASGTDNINHALLLIGNALCDLSGLVELSMVKAIPNLAVATQEVELRAWLKAGDFTNWRAKMPSKEAIEQVNTFLASYGHRALHEGEIARPRWSEEITPLMQLFLAQMEGASTTLAATTKADVQSLLAALPSNARKQGEQTIRTIGELHQLQSNALHTLAYIWAGTRTWALAAAREAMVDKRLHSTDEVFLFELEEIKQMMTGEWNISSLDEIREMVAKRQSEQAALHQEAAPDILVGDAEAFATGNGLAGVGGRATAPLSLLEANHCRSAIVASPLLDSGHVLALPLAKGFVAALGTPCDPFVVAAHAWQQPVVVGLGKEYEQLHEGASTTIEVSAAVVKVSQE